MSRRPYKRSADPAISQLQDVAQSAADATTPGFITGVATIADLRQTRGDVKGQAGPPTITLGGTMDPGDGGGDTYVWRPGDSRDDNNGDNSAGDGIVQVIGVARGRWVRASAADKTAALNVFTATAAGLAPASGGGTANFMRADGTWAAPPLTPAPPGKSLIRTSVLTSGTSLVKATGTTLARAWLWGAGAGGGGAAAGAAGQNAVAGGGESGAPAFYVTTTIPATWTYAIGAKGTGGANTGTSGTNGGDTTFSDGTTTVTAQGGRAGTGGTSSASAQSIGGGSGATASNGTVNGAGTPGGNGFALASGASPVMRGAGGASSWGGNGRGGGVVSGSSAGNNATGYASGGSGAGAAASSGSGAVGGDGFQGIIILEEWG